MSAEKMSAPRDDNPWLERLTENAWLLIVLLVPVAAVVGIIQGPGAAILVLIAAALITVIALFWASVRTLLGETPLSGADAYALAAPRAEEEQKQAVLRALKDLEFERSVGKISEEDYAALVAKYRAEAKRLLRAIDEDAKPRRERVEDLVRRRLAEAGLAPPPDAPADTSRSPDAPPDKPKKKRRRRTEDMEAPPAAPPHEPEAAREDVERRVEIEPAGEPEKAPAAKKPRSVDITWKSPLPTKTKESPAFVPATKTCAECGAKNDPDANFCKKCGSKAFEGGKTRVSVEASDAAPAKAPPDPEAEAENEAAENEAAEHEAAENEAAENEAAENEAAEAPAKGST